MCLLTAKYAACLPTSPVHCCISHIVCIIIAGFLLASVCVIFFFGEGRLFWRRPFFVLGATVTPANVYHSVWCTVQTVTHNPTWKFEIKRRLNMWPGSPPTPHQMRR
jgi:hypothetical protein